jgi:ABC-type transport system involved in cytochrome bd biosynthesis fused ATPase/permease subunit
VGIVGESGAGKTTLIDIILGFHRPSSGTIEVNQSEDLHLSKCWLNMVAYIPQTPFIVDDTIRRNIALGVDENLIDEVRMKFAIESTRLDPLVRRIDSEVGISIGDRGIRLSGGQRQRLAIARALYFDRQFLVFDEATSALDAETELEVLAAIQSIRSSRTIVFVTHRRSVLAACDMILEVRNGMVLNRSL